MIQKAQSFAFVEYNGPERGLSANAESTIRRHAMKEIGKSRRKRILANAVELDISVLPNDSEDLKQPSWWLGRIWRQADSGILDLFVRYPVDIDPLARRLIANVFQDVDGQQKPLRDAWFTVGLEDKAAFLQVLANSALHLDSMLHGGRLAHESSDSMKYHARALKSIQRRVTDGITSDGLIGSVTGLMCHADIVGNSREWATHHHGLQRIVKLRGGIEKLEGNAHLRVTISWCELRGIYMLDAPPAFPVPWQWRGYLPSPTQRRLASRHDINIPMAAWLADAGDMCQIYGDLLECSLGTFGRSSKDKASLDLETTGAWINPMIHRLLSWRPSEHDQTPERLLQEGFRLAALLYLAPIWRYFGVAPVVTETLVCKLKCVLFESVIDWNKNRNLRMWALCIGGCESLGSHQAEWFIAELALLLRELGIKSWGVAMSLVKTVLWADVVLGTRAFQLGEDVIKRLESDRS